MNVRTHSDPLADRRLRSDLARAVRRKVDLSDVEDVVQATLMEVLACPRAPDGPEDLRRFVFAVAKQKVADLHRKRGRDRRLDWTASEAKTPPPVDLLRWAERVMPHAPDAKKTFEWMLREGEGETLAEIAEAERVAPTVVRQRVSRLRRFFRETRAKEIAAFVATLLLVIGVGMASWLLGRHEAEVTRPAPETAMQRAAQSTPAPPPSASAHSPAPPASAAPPPSASPPPKPAPPPRPLERPSRLGIDMGDPWGTLTFDRAAAAAALARVDLKPCALVERTTPATGHATITFAPAGTVDTVVVDGGPLAGTPEGVCVAARFGKVRVARFDSPPGPVKVGKSFVVPAARPVPDVF
jgi:DNA-directed RNA polymerase specialized sigma24 family protein